MKRKTSVRHLVPGLITLGLSVFVLAVVIGTIKDRHLIKTQAATTVWQCANATSAADCTNHTGCTSGSITCSTYAGSVCPTGSGCQVSPLYNSCSSFNESTCKYYYSNNRGCTPTTRTTTASCSNYSGSSCPSGCLKNPIYSSCNTSTCSTSGCSCSTSYSCTGPYYCSGLSYSGCSLKRSMGCGWSSRTTASGSYLSGYYCSGTYTYTSYSGCTGQYVANTVCTGTGYACSGPTRICNAGETSCPSTSGCFNGTSTCPYHDQNSSDYKLVCSADGQTWTKVQCVPDNSCVIGNTGCTPW